jgi:hypothetical protein
MNAKKIIVFCTLFFSFSGHSQTIAEVFQRLVKQYSSAQPLQYKSSYMMYKDADSKKVTESYAGVFIKNASNEVYVKIGPTEILNSKKVNVRASDAQKAVLISDPVKNYMGEFDMKSLLELCKVESFIDYNTYWEITLMVKQFSALPYSKIVIQVTKGYFLQKQVFYYDTAINFSKDYRSPDTHYPRLEITHTGFNRNPVNTSLFLSKTYFSLSKDNKIVLVARLKKYEIVDKRTVSNTIK